MAVIVAFLFKDVFIDIYNKFQDKPEKIEENKEEVVNTQQQIIEEKPQKSSSRRLTPIN